MCIRHVGTLTCSEWAEIRSMQKNPPHHEILVQMVSNRIWLGTRDWFILLFLIGCGHGFSLTKVTRGKKEIKTHSRWQLDIKVPTRTGIFQTRIWRHKMSWQKRNRVLGCHVGRMMVISCFAHYDYTVLAEFSRKISELISEVRSRAHLA